MFHIIFLNNYKSLLLSLFLSELDHLALLLLILNLPLDWHHLSQLHLLSWISNLLLLHHDWLYQRLRNWNVLINHLSLHHLVWVDCILFHNGLHLLELLGFRLLSHHLLTILELLLVRINL